MFAQLRVNQLTKQQNQLMRESEAAVAKRESLLLRNEAAARSSQREKAVAELKRSSETLIRRIKRSKLVGEEDFYYLQAFKNLAVHLF